MVSAMRLSSVVPATMTGDGNKFHELTNMDLAMKLHYIRGIYFFSSDAAKGLTIHDLKKPMFPLLQLYFTTAGRIRRSEIGRPFIKCNDGGVRIAEVSYEESVDEWLAMAIEDSSLFNGLAYNQALGPDIGFCPLVFLQFSWFKCGGMSVGLSWANVLGDVFSAAAFINTWGKIMAGIVPPKSLHGTYPRKSEIPVHSIPKTPSSVKRVDSVGDYWQTSNNYKMRRHTFQVSSDLLDELLSNICCPNLPAKESAFQVLSAIIWKSMSKIKGNSEQTRIVTICTNSCHTREFESPSNGMVLSIVEADFSIAKADVLDLVDLIINKRAEENGIIKEMMETKGDNSDFIAYGAKLTFVNMEEAEIYGLELKGRKPVHANYFIDGVGDEGVVLVLPGPKYRKEDSGTNDGRLVTVILPEDELAQLKSELRKNWSIA